MGVGKGPSLTLKRSQTSHSRTEIGSGRIGPGMGPGWNKRCTLPGGSRGSLQSRPVSRRGRCTSREDRNASNNEKGHKEGTEVYRLVRVEVSTTQDTGSSEWIRDRTT